MDPEASSFLIRYRHDECKVERGVEWYDVWSCACNGQCPACGTKDIEPIDWRDTQSCFSSPDAD